MYSLIALLFLSTVHAQLEVDGPCDLTRSISNLSGVIYLEELAGTWYQVQRIPNDVESGECSRSVIKYSIEEFNKYDKPSEVTSIYKYDSEVVNHKRVQRNGTFTSDGESDIEIFTFSYDGVSQNYKILGSDGRNYLMLYSCKNSGGRSIISAWKFGRKTTYSEKIISLTRTLSDSANIPDEYWINVSHTEAACKIRNGAAMLQISPFILMIVAVFSIQ
ncbi:bilin-binding protein [Bicyclus anynana]|uniref:Bilin-binding protein n=1 Tax=Bicyclus anynana TaxID=110368 RepID=A0A6J1NS91_BICAN|nr:bilin-binding protein [Bicyclus anynana]